METYKTLKNRVESEVYRVKGSKFIGFAFPVETRDEIEAILQGLRAEHGKANHCCYAWKLGKDQVEYRFNDDGEPTNSAGKPIYGQILSYDLTDVLVAVIRYFGGTKLGVGGLIQAYREAASLALKEAEVVRREITVPLLLQFGYPQMDRVMRLIKEKQLKLVSQEMEMDVRLQLEVGKAKLKEVQQSLEKLHEVKVSRSVNGSSATG